MLLKSHVRAHSRRLASGAVAQVHEHEDRRHAPEIGVNVRNAAESRYADLIVDGKKHYETRKKPTLNHLVGKRISIVRTGEGKAMAIGAATVGKPIHVETEEEFRKLQDKHLVPAGSKFDIGPEGKWLYPMLDPVRFDKEKAVSQYGIVQRKVLEKAFASLLKSRVRAHTRRTKSGAVSVVREHEDSRQKKPETPVSASGIRSALRLDKPIKGPTGAEIIAYEWRSMLVEEWSDKKQDVVTRRVSDWDQSETSEGTGREIVHVFFVQRKDGTLSAEGINSAQKILGIPQPRLLTIAKREQAAQAERARQLASTLKEYEARAQDTKAEAARRYRLANCTSPFRSEAENEAIFQRSVLYSKGGKYLRTQPGTDGARALEDAGWAREELAKSHVRAHERHLASGAVAQVHEYDDSRHAKPDYHPPRPEASEEAPAPKKYARIRVEKPKAPRGEKPKKEESQKAERAYDGQVSAEEAIKILEKTGFVPTGVIRDMLGPYPDHFDGMIRFMEGQREKTVAGTLTPRDIAKAYFLTISSIGTSGFSVERFTEVTGLVPGDEFVTEEKTKKGVKRNLRPEEACAFWLHTDEGQKALDGIEKGEFDHDLWRRGADMRDAFADDRFGNYGVFKEPKRVKKTGEAKSYSFHNLGELTEALNAVKGDSEKLDEILLKVHGISEGKVGFIKHLLGIGDTPTIDAVEINTWLAGDPDTRRLSGERAEAARKIRAASDPEVKARFKAMVLDRYRELWAEGLGRDIPREVFGHIMHDWIWYRMKGISPKDKMMYAAMHKSRTEPLEAPGFNRRHSTQRLDGRLEFQGLPISVETRRGAYRLWKDPAAGDEGLTRMKHPYGYVQGSLGVDGDAVDVFVGPHLDATHAYVVHQMAAPDFDTYDEDKVLLGFLSEAEARKAYLAHYDDPRFLGEIVAMPMEEFKAKVLSTRHRGRMLKACLIRKHVARRGPFR